jgi:hypothetical protein
MKLIAHRGVLEGPNSYLENNPTQINHALSLGYDCEIDLWYVEDKLYLGHDAPQYLIESTFLDQPGLWIHAKNFSALSWLANAHEDHNFFWHQTDDFTITNKGYIWTFPNRPLGNKSICVMPETFMDLTDCAKMSCYGTCSDYIISINNMLSQGRSCIASGHNGSAEALHALGSLSNNL